MRQIFPRTFFGQLVLATILAQTLSLVCFTSYIISSQRITSAARSQERMQQQLSLLSQACGRHLAGGDLAGAQEVLSLSRIATSIDTARLTDLQGTTLAVDGNEHARGLDPSELIALQHASQPRVFSIQNGQLEGMTPIVVQGRTLALLWLEPSRSTTLNTLHTVERICLTYGSFALLANLLPIFIVVQRMTRPLKRLRLATHSLVADHQTGVSFPLPITTSNEAGELTAAFNHMVQDLNDQRSGLLETLALLDSMLGNAPIGFAFFDRDMRFTRVNTFLAGTHAAPAADHVGRSLQDVYPASIAAVYEHHIASVFATGQPLRDIEITGVMPSSPGLQRTWVVQFYPVHTLQQVVRWVGAIVVEVTERLQAEDALRKNEKLAAAGRLAASIAHEINNPLESVTNLLYLLETDDTLQPEAHHLVATAQAELARVSEITQQTLRFYRQSSSASPINVAEVLNSVLTLYHPRLVQARIEVVRKLRGEPSVFGFGGELRQLFANLIGNALDAMHDGGCLSLHLRPGSGRHPDGSWGPGTRISVIDSGVGMSQDTLQHVFEAFFTTKQATGTGLGLWVSDEIIRKHHGTVRIRSRLGQHSGTSFLLFFPATGSTAE